MGFMDALIIRKAIRMHQRGREAEARAVYEQMYERGNIMASYLLPYCVLLLREGGEENYVKVKEILKKAEKAPDLDQQRRQELIMDYAVAQYKLGELEKAVSLLEASHKKTPCGYTYQALGFLYIEAGDAEKALGYNLEALDYDDEDSVVLDNLGQVYYRLLNDRKTAKEYFDRAIALKKNQIDTLYFLSRYDLEAGNKAAALEKLRLAAQGKFSPLNYVTKAQVTEEIRALEGGTEA